MIKLNVYKHLYQSNLPTGRNKMLTIRELVHTTLSFNEAREMIEASGSEFLTFTAEFGIHDRYPFDLVNTRNHAANLHSIWEVP